MAPSGHTGPCLLQLALLLAMLTPAPGIFLQGNEESYARFPKWNACVNATISFEFKTTQPKALLMYVDDGGMYDFFQVVLSGGEVSIELNIVDGKDGRVYLNQGRGLNDGRWHKVEIRRNRMETTLIVDDVNQMSEFAFGSDFNFGKLEDNSYVYFGGMPNAFMTKLPELALPSVMFNTVRMQGSFRNILYGNCTCQTSRAQMIQGVGVLETGEHEEQCDKTDPCREGCICISTDDNEPGCDCSEMQCVTGAVVHYLLPMDRISGTTVINPSGLDATAFGNPDIFSPGILKGAIRLRDKNQFIRAAGPGHRYECFGDLDKCPLGYTMAFWMNFEEMAEKETVFLSNGGHTDDNHGVAMLYDKGTMEFRFRRKNGQEWSAKSDNILPGRWYHVTAAWSLESGLSVYVDGDLVDVDISPVVRGSGNLEDNKNREFFIGRPNDDTPVTVRGKMSMDEFNFWSTLKTPEQIREQGPFYCYELSMDDIEGRDVMGSKLKTTIRGSSSVVEGKMGDALSFDGRRTYIEGGDQSATCLGDMEICQYGITVAMWIKFDNLEDATQVISSGNKGFKIYFKSGQLYGEVQQGDRSWEVNYGGLETGIWYYLEISWEPLRGLKMFVDMKEVASESRFTTEAAQDGTSELYIGRDNTEMRSERYLAASVDEIQMCYGDRKKLLDTGFIIRGRPTQYQIGFDDKVGNRISHSTLEIDLFGQPQIVQGKVVGALQLNGQSQFASLGAHQKECLGNLDRCRHGLLVGHWIKPGQLRSGMEFLSSGANGIRAWYEGNKLKVKVRTSTRVWSLETDKFNPDMWQFLEFAWHPTRGLDLYVNDKLVAESSKEVVRDSSELLEYNPEGDQFFIGRGDGSSPSSRYVNATFDEMEYWFGNREYLIAHGYLQRGKPIRYYFNMDTIRNNRLLHPTVRVTATGDPETVPAIFDTGVRLDGNDQYLDIGDHSNTCLGSLSRCQQGTLTSYWINFKDIQDGEYYYTNGDGVKVFARDGRIYVTMETGGKKWEVPLSNINTDTWYFLEHTWTSEKGLRVYLDTKVVGTDAQGRSVPARAIPSDNHVYVGNANPSDADGGRIRPANVIIDEMETWFSDRDFLLANDYIIRENVTHYMIPFEERRGDSVVHEHFDITLENDADLTSEGKIGNAAEILGRGEFVDFGDQSEECFGNLEKCKHGLTLIFWLKPKEMLESGYFLSSGPYHVWYENGQTRAKFSTTDKVWEISTDRIQPDQWQRVDLSWDEERGLQMYVDKKLAASTREYTSPSRPQVFDNPNVYLGRPSDDIYSGRYSNAVFDEMEVWYANRDHLVAFGLIVDDIKKLIIDMDEIRGDVLMHPDITIYVRGRPVNVPGTKDNAVKFNGINQYVDVARDIVVCNGALDNCKKGFTLRFAIQPDELKDNTYFVSSSPFDVYYEGGRLYADFRTPKREWSVNTNEINPESWHQVDVSWHPSKGLKLYVNGRLVDQQTYAFPNDRYDEDMRLMIGRANGDMRDNEYVDGTMDEVELWEAERDLLINEGLITDPDLPTPSPGPPEVITFDGDYWVKYKFSDLPEDYHRDNTYEQFHVKFQTEEPTGLLWFSGNSERNMHLTMKNGAIVFLVDYGDGQIDKYRLRPGAGRLDDGEWHDVYITRDGREVTITIDGVETPLRDLQGDTSINSGTVFLGGSADNGKLTDGVIRKNFNGVIETTIMHGNTLPDDLDMVDMYLREPRPTYVIIKGALDPDVTPAPIPGPENGITFLRPNAYLRLPQWDAQRTGKISLKFRTVEPHGIMLYNGPKPGYMDFMAVEMYDGVAYFVIDLGDGAHRFPFGDGDGTIVNDGDEHEIQIQRIGRSLMLTLDGELYEYRIPSSTDDLDLGTFLFLGGIDRPSRLDWNIWARQPKFFVGCMWELRVNDIIQDLQSFRTEQGMINYIGDGCAGMPYDCGDRPCIHGECVELWDMYTCDCSDTPYTGPSCAEDANLVFFNGSDLVRVRIIPVMTTHVNDMSLRFKTPKPNGLLFQTSNDYTNDFLKVALESGRGKLMTNLGGRTETMYFCENLADDEWHTLYIKRRANHVEAWVDECPHSKVILTGEGYTLDIDEILVAAPGRGATYEESFVGHMQNFIVDGNGFFEMENGGNTPEGNEIIVDGLHPVDSTKPIPMTPVTFREGTNSYVQLQTLQLTGDTGIYFLFKTKQKDGIILYNDGRRGDFVAVELVDGFIHFIVEDGSGTKVVRAATNRLSDNGWHSVEIKQTGPTRFSVTVDRSTTSVDLTGGVSDIDLSDRLYLGGLPQAMYDTLPALVNSRQGFAGCLATVKLNGRLYNLWKDAISKTQFVSEGCSDATGFCKPDTCKHFGECLEGVSTFICDCNMTAHVGRICTEEPEGYRYSNYEDYIKGITVYEMKPPQDTDEDMLAFGFMTWHGNGTLVRIESGLSADHIHAKLENGHVVIYYDIGDHQYRVAETRKMFNDGQYHYVTFRRKGASATVRVDDFPMLSNTVTGSGSRQFNQMKTILVGGNRDQDRNILEYFNGIIAGVYLNGFRVVDEGVRGNIHVKSSGEYKVAKHPFYLPRPPAPPVTGGATAGPPPVTARPIPGGGDIPDFVPASAVGGGVAWVQKPLGAGPGRAPGSGVPGSGGADGRPPPGVMESMYVHPGGGGAGATAGGEGPVSAGLVQAGGGLAGEGARAAAVAGALIGLLLLGSGIGWALYKFKPGLISSGGGGGGGAAALNISSPRATSNYQLVKAVGGLEMNGNVIGGGVSNIGTQTTIQGQGIGAYSQQFTTMSAYNTSNTASGVAGVLGGAGTVTRPVQTDLVYAFYGGYGDGYANGNGYAETSLTTNAYETSALLGSAANMANEGTQTLDLADSGTQTLPLNGHAGHAGSYSYQESKNYASTTNTQHTTTNMAHGFAPIEGANTLGYGTGASTMGGSSFQMKNVSLNQQNYATGLMAAEEIRVDCVQLSDNGRYVVTGSLFGPPQIWDMRTGELVRVVAGENFSSTDLHIAGNGTLLVGQVAELTQIDDPSAANNLHNRKLQIWDFETGNPLEMGNHELCTASCLMSDGERVVLGRTDKFGAGTTIVIWDMMANEAVRKLKYDGAVGFADYISFLKLSKDNRYVIAGFQNSYDGNANYIIFDLTADDNQEPKIIAFDASTDVTAILDNHEAVTGTRQGELIIWSMRTGKALRQMVAPASQMHRGGLTVAAAHLGEVKALDVSADGQYLVSASADTTLKVWSMETDRLLYTLRGHTDEVWCCTISEDNDMIVSGSRDCTIRLWRLLNGVPVCAFSCGVDIFTVRMSKNKKTIVALGDKFASRKLIMLQIVHTKTRSRAGSRATSPMGRPISPIGTPLNRRTPDPYMQY